MGRRKPPALPDEPCDACGEPIETASWIMLDKWSSDGYHTYTIHSDDKCRELLHKRHKQEVLDWKLLNVDNSFYDLYSRRTTRRLL